MKITFSILLLFVFFSTVSCYNNVEKESEYIVEQINLFYMNSEVYKGNISLSIYKTSEGYKCFVKDEKRTLFIEDMKHTILKEVDITVNDFKHLSNLISEINYNSLLLNQKEYIEARFLENAVELEIRTQQTFYKIVLIDYMQIDIHNRAKLIEFIEALKQLVDF